MNVVAQRLEQASQHRLAPGTGQDGEAGLQGQRCGGKLWPRLATTAERRAKHVGDGHAEE